MSVDFSITAKQIAYRARDLVYGLRKFYDKGNFAKLLNKKIMFDTINNNSSRGAPLTDTEVATLTLHFNSMELAI